MRRKMLGEDHTAVARTTHNMAVVAMGAGEHDASEKAFREALTRLRRTLGNDHPDVAGALANWGRLRLKIKDLDGAETMFRQALDTRLRTLGKDNPAVGESTISLGRVQSAKSQYADAERLLLDGRTICQTANGPTDRWVKTANEELAKLYEAWGKPDRAAEVRALLPQPQPSPAAK
jgi:Tfp pilus assembly protein PilF